MSLSIVPQTAQTVNSADRFGVNGLLGDRIVINEKVTEKIRYAQSLTDEDIRKAGKSSLSAKDGVLVNKHGVFISGSLSGKMLGMPGISGYAGNNRLCIERALNGNSVCAHCYSLTGIWRNCIPAYTKNDIVLSSVKFEVGDLVLDPEKIPYMRYSTHGDTINATNVYDALVSARTNPKTQVTLWTKNTQNWVDGLKMYCEEFKCACKPSNFFTLWSPLQLDFFPNDFLLEGMYLIGIDAIFGVYKTYASQEKAIEAGAVKCICGPGSCRYHCKFCYDRKVREASGKIVKDKALWIAEILDGARHKE